MQCPAVLRAWESGGGWVRSENGAFTGRKWVTGCKTLEKKKKKKTLEKTEFQVKELKCIQQPMESLNMFTQDYEIPKSV